MHSCTPNGKLRTYAAKCTSPRHFPLSLREQGTLANLAWQWFKYYQKEEPQLLLTNCATHLCNIQWCGWLIGTTVADCDMSQSWISLCTEITLHEKHCCIACQCMQHIAYNSSKVHTCARTTPADTAAQSLCYQKYIHIVRCTAPKLWLFLKPTNYRLPSH